MGTGQYSGSPATPFKKRRDPKKGFHGKAGCLVLVSWTWALLSNMLKKNITSVVIALHTSKLNENNYCTASDERKHNDKKRFTKYSLTLIYSRGQISFQKERNCFKRLHGLILRVDHLVIHCTVKSLQRIIQWR